MASAKTDIFIRADCVLIFNVCWEFSIAKFSGLFKPLTSVSLQSVCVLVSLPVRCIQRQLPLNLSLCFKNADCPWNTQRGGHNNRNVGWNKLSKPVNDSSTVTTTDPTIFNNSFNIIYIICQTTMCIMEAVALRGKSSLALQLWPLRNKLFLQIPLGQSP